MNGWPIAGGLALTAAGWLAARFSARAPVRLNWALPLDLAGPFGLWAILFAASARPWFAGAASLAVFVGFAFADTTKRATLREPVVFSDMSELFELFRHPGLYLPFAGTGTVIAGAIAVLVALGSILLIEPGQWTPWSPLPGVIAVAIVVAVTLATSREPLLGRLADLARRARPRGDPASSRAPSGRRAGRRWRGRGSAFARAAMPRRSSWYSANHSSMPAGFTPRSRAICCRCSTSAPGPGFRPGNSASPAGAPIPCAPSSRR
jgi:hypothetical protein